MVELPPWRQVNIAYPSHDPHERERQAIAHLARVLPAAEADGLITSWSFIRKGRWRVRYLLGDETSSQDGQNADPVHSLLTNGVTWTDDFYEPEFRAFGGPQAMDTAHTLFHKDSQQLLSALRNGPAGRRERSLILCTALMRSADLDLNEQADVWAQIAEQRAALLSEPQDQKTWPSFTADARRFLLGTARPDIIASDWLTAFEDAGKELKLLREAGKLTRGIRAVTALHVIFHWNRFGLAGATWTS
jgi:thiopeptide-type bacteriocin biosynthesis protein